MTLLDLIKYVAVFTAGMWATTFWTFITHPEAGKYAYYEFVTFWYGLWFGFR